MDFTEQAFLRVHHRLTGLLSTFLTPRFRRCLEYLCLLNAVTLLGVLVFMHINFVGQPACAAEFMKPELTEAQMLEVKVTGVWTQMASQLLQDFQERAVALKTDKPELRQIIDQLREETTTRRVEDWGQLSSCRLGPDGADSETGGSPVCSLSGGSSGNAGSAAEGAGFLAVAGRVAIGGGVGTGPGRGPLGTALAHYVHRWTSAGAAWMDRAEMALREGVKKVLQGLWPSDQPANKARANYEALMSEAKHALEYLRTKIGDPVYVFSTEKGYLMLSDVGRARYGIRTTNVTISATNACFGGKLQRLLIDNLIGYDTILMNSLLAARGRGYFYNLQTKEVYNLNYGQELNSGSAAGTEEYLIFKFGVLITSLFVFFTTTMSVSFTLRETQHRMLKFTVHLQHHARHRLPTFRLIFVHIVESLVFVPIMIGILFFLFEFFDDQLLAFMVMTLVWLCELFKMISVRTRVAMQYFPRFFFLYFLIFHIYFFSYSYGFSYLAFFSTVAFLQHTVLFFWNRYEVPELARQRQQGHSVNSPPQGVHITSAHLTMFDSLGTFHSLSANAVPGTNAQVPRNISGPAPGGGPPSVPGGTRTTGAAPEEGSRREADRGVTSAEESGNRLPRGSGLSGLGSIYASLLSGSSEDLASLAERRNSGTFSLDGSRRDSGNERAPSGVINNPSTNPTANPLSNGPSSGLPWVLGGSQGPLVSWIPMFREQDGGMSRVPGNERGVSSSGIGVARREEAGGVEERSSVSGESKRLALPQVVEEPSREDYVGGLGSPVDANASGDYGVRRRDHHRGRRWRSWEEP